MQKKLYLIGWGVYAIMLFYSVLYFKERFAFIDGANFLFTILQKGSFAIFHSRYIAIFTEIFPLVASKLSLSLSAVTLSYSVGFTIYYSLCYFICGTVFKRYDFALVALLINILFVTHTFYWLISELPQGMNFIVVFLAFLSQLKDKKINLLNWVLLVFFVIVIVWSHPLAMLPFGFCMVFFYVAEQPPIARKHLILSTVLYAAFFIIKYLFFRDKYDASSIGAAKNLVRFFPNYFNIYSNHAFIAYCKKMYYWIPALFLLNTVNYVRNKKWKQLLVFQGFFLAYFFLINVSYYKSDVSTFYIENLYLPLGIMLALPFVFDAYTYLLPGRIFFATCLLFMVSWVYRVYDIGKFYVARLNWERNFLLQHHNEKLIVGKSILPMDTVVKTWATPYEFWLISTMETDTTASITMVDNPMEYYWAAHERTKFLPAWGLFSYSEMPRRYFKLYDTTTSYITLDKH
jgi:hypothetical protein